METKTYKMKHFTPGKRVIYDGDEYYVDYVTIRGYDIFVHLKGHHSAVHADRVQCELTTFLLERQ